MPVPIKAVSRRIKRTPNVLRGLFGAENPTAAILKANRLAAKSRVVGFVERRGAKPVLKKRASTTK